MQDSIARCTVCKENFHPLANVRYVNGYDPMGGVMHFQCSAEGKHYATSSAGIQHPPKDKWLHKLGRYLLSL